MLLVVKRDAKGCKRRFWAKKAMRVKQSAGVLRRAAIVYFGCLGVAAVLIYGALWSLEHALALVAAPRVAHSVTSDEQIEAALTALAVVAAATAWAAWCVTLARVWRSMPGHLQPTLCQSTPTPWLRVAALALGVSWFSVAHGAAVAAPEADRPSTESDNKSGDRTDVDHLHGLAMPTLPSAGRPLGAREAVHVVVSGDSLWDLAAGQMSPGTPAATVDARWRRIYAHNRSTVGDDPDLLIPGQRLQMPAPIPTRTRS